MNSTDSTIFVTKYIGDRDHCLFVKTPDYVGIVVTKEGKFVGLAHSPSTHVTDRRNYAGCLVSSRPNVNKAVKDFLEKKSQKKEAILVSGHEGFVITCSEDSQVTTMYTGDEAYKGCIYVPSEGYGNVIDCCTREQVGYASSSDGPLSKRLPNTHPCSKAIDEYLFTKPGSLQQGYVQVCSYSGETYKNHLLVSAYDHRFLVSRETREVVALKQKKPLDTEYFKRLDKAVKFSSVVEKYVRGIRGTIKEEKTVRTILQPFQREYLLYSEKQEKSTYIALIGSIVTCLAQEDLQVIIEAYPAFNNGESVRMALENLFCKK